MEKLHILNCERKIKTNWPTKHDRCMQRVLSKFTIIVPFCRSSTLMWLMHDKSIYMADMSSGLYERMKTNIKICKTKNFLFDGSVQGVFVCYFSFIWNFCNEI